MSVDVENYTFTPDVAPKLGPKGGARFAAAALRYGALLSFLAILVIFSVAAPFFLSIFNIGNILGQRRLPACWRSGSPWW